MNEGGYNYEVVIMNNSKIVDDDGGFLHTWLVFSGPDNIKEYFSYGANKALCAFTKNCYGVSTVDEKLKKRKATEAVYVKIDKNNYELMIEEVKNFYYSRIKYCLIPSRGGEFNCVTSARQILNAASINFLDDVDTPIGVGKKIKKDPNYKERDLETCTAGILGSVLAPSLVVGGIIIGGLLIYNHNQKKKKA